MNKPTTSERNSRSSFGLLLAAAEKGWLPDAMIRFGIRRLLKNRLQEIDSNRSDSTIDDFLRATQPQPIAVVPEKANDQHYEVPAEFFRQVLGTRLKYSSCYWPDNVDSLDQAEEEALRTTCQNANLENGMDILELGCGWGSLSLWMAQQYPQSRITSISNSHSQRRFIQRQANSLGLSNLEIVTVDINNYQTDQVFDRVVSVEMFEHMRNHGRLMQRIHDWLRPGGQLFVHIFCHKNTPYLFRSDGEQNWMGRYFFTGGMMPSEDLLERSGSALKLVLKTKWNGRHYARTCRAWLQNQDAAKRSLLTVLASTYGEDDAIRWHHRWRLFFMACEELFAYNQGNEWFVSHYSFERCPNG